jgi:hypothetical protein
MTEEGPPVLDYRLFYLRGGHIARADEFYAEGDSAALDQANARRGDQPAELWNRARMVARLGETAPADRARA